MFGKLFDKLKTGLTKTRDGLQDKINEALHLAVTIDDDLYEELEEILIISDIGMDTTVEIIDRLKAKIRKEKINDPQMVKPALKEVITEMLLEGATDEEEYNLDKEKEVLLVIGVNGVGKTTSIGKLAAKNKEEGKKVLLAAADTFRAAAIDQLEGFASLFGADFYCLPRNTNTITLVKEEQTIPTSLDYLDGEQIIPLYAGKTIQWRKV